MTCLKKKYKIDPKITSDRYWGLCVIYVVSIVIPFTGIPYYQLLMSTINVVVKYKICDLISENNIHCNSENLFLVRLY